MIYLKQTYNLSPASPETRDRFVSVMEQGVLESDARLGARLVGAFFAHEEWFSQLIHVSEFDDLAAYDRYRKQVASDAKASDGAAQLAQCAPEQHLEILEPLGPIEASAIHDAIEASKAKPQGVYTFAILETAPGQAENFSNLLGAAKAGLPIIAAWREVSGKPNRITDLWKGDIGKNPFTPNTDAQAAFFGPLRQVAPREKLMRLHVMPYSPLR